MSIISRNKQTLFLMLAFSTALIFLLTFRSNNFIQESLKQAQRSTLSLEEHWVTRTEQVKEKEPTTLPPQKKPRFVKKKKKTDRKEISLNSLYSNPNRYKTIFTASLNNIRRRLIKDFKRAKSNINFVPGKKVDASNQKKVLILSTWRSGSTFLGDLLQSFPGTFYSFEPLHIYLKNQHMEGGPGEEKVLNLMKDIFTCNIQNQLEYLDYIINTTYLISTNTQLWNTCIYDRSLCFDPKFLSEYCQYMPIITMKTVRLGLAPVMKIADDPNLFVIHLVRDPRGVLNSRKSIDWCISDVCKDPKTVCSDLYTDLLISHKYYQLYPKNHMLLRYEDLSVNTELVTKEILQFLGLSYDLSVKKFIEKHTNAQKPTKVDNSYAYSTFRDSRSTAFAWREAYPYEEMKKIQDDCLEPITALNYKVFNSDTEYNDTSINLI